MIRNGDNGTDKATLQPEPLSLTHSGHTHSFGNRYSTAEPASAAWQALPKTPVREHQLRFGGGAESTLHGYKHMLLLKRTDFSSQYLHQVSYNHL